MEKLEDIMKKYKLSEEEHDEIFKKIKEEYFFGKEKTKEPTAIINIAPPASGKTGLNIYSANEFKNQNVIIINSDLIKRYHPKIDEIARKYPEYFTKITDQDSNTWTSDLFDEALKEGYNVIFEGTGKNARILNTIKEKMQGYHVIVRGMAVHELDCLQSILMRYFSEVEKRGCGRFVTLDHFYETYKGMPETIKQIEESGVVDQVEIYKRGKSKERPQIIYNSNEERIYPSAQQAVLQGREETNINALLNLKKNEERIRIMVNNSKNNEEIGKTLNKILEIAKYIRENELNIGIGLDEPV